MKTKRQARPKGETRPQFYVPLLDESPKFFIVYLVEVGITAVSKECYELVPEPTLQWVDITDNCAVEDGHLFDQTNLPCQRLILGFNAPITPGYRLVQRDITHPNRVTSKSFGVQRQDLLP
ncbi:MAG: hypothetical protein HY348_09030 [Nitrospira defluvii]|nr:hypothetical protein [Nitrospira defluvii]